MSEPTPVVPAVEPVTENTEKVAETVVENTEVVEENAGEIIEKVTNHLYAMFRSIQSETVKTRIVSFFDGIGEKIVALYEWGVNCGSNKQPTECPCEEVIHKFLEYICSFDSL